MTNETPDQVKLLIVGSEINRVYYRYQRYFFTTSQDKDFFTGFYSINNCADFASLSLSLKFGLETRGEREKKSFITFGQKICNILKQKFNNQQVVFSSQPAVEIKTIELLQNIRVNGEFINIIIENLTKLREISNLTDTLGGPGGNIGEMPTQIGNFYINLRTGRIVAITNSADLPFNERVIRAAFKVAFGTDFGRKSDIIKRNITIVAYMSGIPVKFEKSSPGVPGKEEVAFQLAIAMFNLGISVVEFKRLLGLM